MSSKRTLTLQTRLTTAERRVFDEAAESAGLLPANALRMIILPLIEFLIAGNDFLDATKIIRDALRARTQVGS